MSENVVFFVGLSVLPMNTFNPHHENNIVMNNSITLEVTAGIVTFIVIALFVSYHIIRFNKHVGDQF